MLKSVAAFFIVTFLLHTFQVCPAGLEVRLLSDTRKEMVAGATSNVLVMFTNQTDTVREFALKLRTDGNNWKQFMNYASNRIEGNSSINKIISINVPEHIRADDYSVVWDVFEKPDNQIIGTITIPIRVLPKYDLNIEKLKAPGYLMGGDTLHVGYRIYNLSNADIQVEANIINGNKQESRFFKIKQDSFVNTNVFISAAKITETYAQQSVTLSAFIREKPEVSSQKTFWFDIIPSEHAKFDGYNRFPVKISSVLAAGNRMNKRYYAVLYDISGSGVIDDIGDKKLAFRFRGPDRRGNPVLGMNDEYYLTYQTRATEIFLGDHNYSLSNLTESSRIGRGVRVQHNFSKTTIGAFYHTPRYYPEIKRTFSVYSNLNINDKIRLAAGYLAKTDTANKTANMFTVSGIMRPASWIGSSFEVAMSLHENQIQKAGMGNINLSTKFFSSHVNIKYADQYFPGYLSNSLVISSGAKANLNKFSLAVNYDRNNANLALDTLYANAPYSENKNLICFFRFNPQNSIGISLNSIQLEDRGKNRLFNYNKYFGRVFTDTKIRHLSLNLYGDYGKITNYLEATDNQTSDMYNGQVSLKYVLNHIFSCSGFLKYQGGNQYQITGFNKYYYGGSFQVNLKKTFFAFDFQSDYELKEYYRDRSLLSLQLHHQPNPRHVFEISTNYNLVKNSLYKKDLNIQVRYTYNLNFPVSKKKNIGSLSGKVINKSTERVDGIMFNLNGQKSVTDKKGYFKFPALKAGTYTLTMDDSNFDINTIAATSGPYEINIEPGKEIQFVTELTKAAKIRGKITIKEDKTDGKGFYPITEEIKKLIVEASNGTEVFRVFTDREGNCYFNDLRPGTWIIRVFKNGIPSGYQLEKEQLTIDLKPADEKEFEINIRKKNREIKFQPGF
jgi:hypothetical protein